MKEHNLKKGRLLMLLLSVAMVLAILLAFSIDVSAEAKTIYVDVNSTAETPDGTEANPYKTIQSAVNAASDGDTIHVKSGNYNVWCPTTNPDNYTGRDHNLFIGKNITIKGEDNVNIYSLQSEYKYAFDKFITVLISGSKGVVLDNLNIYPVYYSAEISGLPTVTESKINQISGEDTLSVYYNQIVDTLMNYNGGKSTSESTIENVTVKNCTIGDKNLDSDEWGSAIYLNGYVNNGATGISGGYVIENNTLYGGICVCEDGGWNATTLEQDCIIRNNNLYDSIILNGERPTGWNYKSVTIKPTITGNNFYAANWPLEDEGVNYNYCVGARDKSDDKVFTKSELETIIENNTFVGDLEGKIVGVAIGRHDYSTKDDEAYSIIYAATPVATVTVDKVATDYADINSALKAANAATGDSVLVELKKDVTIDVNWDQRSNGGQINKAMTIDGKNHTLKLLAGTNDAGNYNCVFRVNTNATIKNLNVDLSEETTSGTLQRVISAAPKIALTVDNCDFTGSTNYTNSRAIIVNEAGKADNESVVTIKNCSFTDWKRGLTVNENGGDTGSITVETNSFTNCGISLVGALNTLTIKSNTMVNSWIRAYSYNAVPTTLQVTLDGNTLVAEDDSHYNDLRIGTLAGKSETEPYGHLDGFSWNARIQNVYYKNLATAINAASASGTGETINPGDSKSIGENVTLGEGDTLSSPQSGSVTVKSGYTLTCDGTIEGTVIISGDLIVTDKGFLKNKPTITDGVTWTVTSGKYGFDPTSYLADGYEAINNGDGTYSVSKIYVAKLYKDDVLIAGYDTINDAVAAFNAATEAGDYEIIISGKENKCTYTVSELEIIQSKTVVKTLLVTAADGKEITLTKGASGNLFNINAQSSFNGGAITFSNLKFDLKGGAYAVNACKDDTTRYAHDLTVSNCDFVNSAVPGTRGGYVFGAQAGSHPRHFVVDSCTCKNINQIGSGYFYSTPLDGTNPGITIKNTTLSGCKAVLNNQGAGSWSKLVNVTATDCYNPLLIQVSGGETATAKVDVDGCELGSVATTDNDKNKVGIISARYGDCVINISDTIFTHPNCSTLTDVWAYDRTTDKGQVYGSSCNNTSVQVTVNRLDNGGTQVFDGTTSSTEYRQAVGEEEGYGEGTDVDTIGTNVAKIGDTLFTSLADAIQTAVDGDTIVLMKNIDALSRYDITGKSITLNLNGKTIEYKGTETLASGVIMIHNGAGLTVKDTSSQALGAIKSGTKAYAAIAVTDIGDDESSPAELTVENGNLEGYYYAICGNGSRQNTEITINGGTISGTCADDSLGIFNPQDGRLIINGGTITGYSSAVEVRAGKIEINGGVLTATADTYSVTPSGSGSTTVGAALAIAQHTTMKDIDVKITGGSFTGVNAISEADPQGNKPENITMSVTGGRFKGEVLLTDVDSCLAGGIYSDKPSDDTYLVTGKAFKGNIDDSTVGDYPYMVDEAEKVVISTSSTLEVSGVKKSTTVATITGGGQYKAGTKVTLKATAVDANSIFTFDGWYVNGTKIENAGAEYTFTAEADAEYVANFTTSSTQEITTTVSKTGDEAAVAAGTVTVKAGTEAGSSSTTKQIGTEVELTATAGTNTYFICWENTDGNVVSTSPTFKATPVQTQTISAVFYDEAAARVSFNDDSGALLKAQMYKESEAGEVTDVVAPAKRGQDFKGWSGTDGTVMTDKEVASAIKTAATEAGEEVKAGHKSSALGIVNVQAVYEKATTYKIVIHSIDSEGTTVCRDLEATATYGESHVVTASLTCGNKTLVGFSKTDDVSAIFTNSASFTISPDEDDVTNGKVEYYAIYGDAPASRIAALSLGKFFDGSTNVHMLAATMSWSLPEGATLDEAGFYYSTSGKEDLDGCSKKYTTTLEDTSGSYTVYMNLQGYEEYYMYMRAFVTYTDQDGTTTHTVVNGVEGSDKGAEVTETKPISDFEYVTKRWKDVDPDK